MNTGGLRLVACACALLLLLPVNSMGEQRQAQTVDELAQMYDVSSC
jgi:hypothetical protein